MNDIRTAHLTDLALEEDAGLGDLTSRAIFPARHRSRAVIDAKQDLVICGLEVAAADFNRVDPGKNNGRALEPADHKDLRSEDHTTELQSPDHIVCRHILEKQKGRRKRI